MSTQDPEWRQPHTGAAASDAANTGLYRRFRCHYCGRVTDLVITVAQLPSQRRRLEALIGTILTDDEYKRFERFDTNDKIVFASGRFHDAYRRCPSGKELSRFVGLNQQTVSKYLGKNTLVASEMQEKGRDGRFEEKGFHLTDEGKLRYAELTYKLIDYQDTKSNGKPLE